MNETNPTSELQWLHGAFLFAGRRPLSPDLRCALLRRLKRARRWTAALLAAAALPLLLSIVLLQTGGTDPDVTLIFGICGSAIVLPFFIVMMFDYGRVAWMVRRNLPVGEVNRYELPAALARLSAIAGRGVEAAGGPDYVETYAGTGHLAGFSGRPFFNWRAPRIVKTAPVPALAASGRGPRALTDLEQAELRRHLKPLTVFRLVTPAVIVSALALLAFAPLFNAHHIPWRYLSLVAMLAMASLAAWLKMISRLRLARRLSADLLRGVVDREEVAPHAGELLATRRSEVLSTAQLPWTLDGLPAPWRRIGL